MQESVLELAKRAAVQREGEIFTLTADEGIRLAQALVEIAHESELACKYPEQSAIRHVAIQHVLNARGDAS